MHIAYKMVLALFLAFAHAANAETTVPGRARKTPVESEVFTAYRYSPSQQTLTLWFRNGGVYKYSKVPAATVRSFDAVQNKGRFFHQNIRGEFAFVRLDTREDTSVLAAREASSAAGVATEPPKSDAGLAASDR